MSDGIDVKVGIILEYTSPGAKYATQLNFESVEVAIAVRNALDVLLVPYEREADA